MSTLFNNLSLNEHLLLHDLFNARVSSFSEVNSVLDKLYHSILLGHHHHLSIFSSFSFSASFILLLHWLNQQCGWLVSLRCVFSDSMKSLGKIEKAMKSSQ